MNNFTTWVKRATSNKRFVYFKGSNISDADDDNTKERIKFAWRLALEGKVYLVQRRRITDEIEYIAIKASKKPCPKLIPSPAFPEFNLEEVM